VFRRPRLRNCARLRERRLRSRRLPTAVNVCLVAVSKSVVTARCLALGEPQIFFTIVLRAYGESDAEPTDSPALFDVYLSNDGTFTTPVKQNLPGSALTKIHFDSAQRAQFVRFQLDAVAGHWWSIHELSISQ
jgi:hypothetical protein